jgi:Leucine-rich repeat (LRR) protein
MRTILACFFVFISFSASSQNGLVCRNYEYALKNASAVTEIEINCMHGDFYGSESCGAIPENIGDCRNLQRFYTSEAYYTMLPRSFTKLKRLKSLDIEYNIGFNYKKELCKLIALDSLEHLGLGMNHIYRFPDCITKMKSLRSLDLSGSDTIDLRHTFNLLSNIPTFEKLDISNLIFINVPAEISSLRKLKSLSVERNDWLNCDTLVDNISQLPIENLNMTKCGLAKLPRGFIRLKQLKALHIDQNNLRRLPKELYELPNLQELSIRENKIREIPEDVAKLRKLRKLDLSGNELVDAASSVRRLATIKALEDLVMSNCNIQLVPEAFSQFKQLRKLEVHNIPDDQLKELLIKLAHVKTLTYLDLSQVRSWDREVAEKPLPSEIGQLTNLEYLILNENGGVHLRLPEEFFNLTKLKELHLAYVKLDKSQEEEIKRRLPGCEVIYEYGRED